MAATTQLAFTRRRVGSAFPAHSRFTSYPTNTNALELLGEGRVVGESKTNQVLVRFEKVGATDESNVSTSEVATSSADAFAGVKEAAEGEPQLTNDDMTFDEPKVSSALVPVRGLHKPRGRQVSHINKPRKRRHNRRNIKSAKHRKPTRKFCFKGVWIEVPNGGSSMPSRTRQKHLRRRNRSRSRSRSRSRKRSKSPDEPSKHLSRPAWDATTPATFGGGTFGDFRKEKITSPKRSQRPRPQAQQQNRAKRTQKKRGKPPRRKRPKPVHKTIREVSPARSIPEADSSVRGHSSPLVPHISTGTEVQRSSDSIPTSKAKVSGKPFQQRRPAWGSPSPSRKRSESHRKSTGSRALEESPTQRRQKQDSAQRGRRVRRHNSPTSHPEARREHRASPESTISSYSQSVSSPASSFHPAPQSKKPTLSHSQPSNKPSAEGLEERQERISGALAEMEDIMNKMEGIEQRAALRIAQFSVDGVGKNAGARGNTARKSTAKSEAPSPSGKLADDRIESPQQTGLSHEDAQTLDFMLEQLNEISETENKVYDRLLLRPGGNGIGRNGDLGSMFRRAQASRRKKVQEMNASKVLSVQGSRVEVGPSELSWAQARSIEKHREAFLSHRALVEMSLRGTGLSQANVVEVLEDLITDELLTSCAKEVEFLLEEFVETIKSEA